MVELDEGNLISMDLSSSSSAQRSTRLTATGTRRSLAIAVLQDMGIERISRAEYLEGFKSTFGSAARSRVLGSGTFATVVLQRDCRKSAGSGIFVATKFLKTHIDEVGAWTELAYQSVLSKDCENIVRIRGWIDDEFSGSAGSPVGARLGGLILEWCQESLQMMWTNFEGLIPEDVHTVVLQGVLRGLVHVHAHAVVHLDLAPGNIMLKWHACAGLVAKIGDFGMSVRLRRPPPGADRTKSWPQLWCDAEREPEFIKDDTPKDACGTWTYRAPEITLGLPYGFPADVWSFGVIAQELFTGIDVFNHTETNCPWTYANYLAGHITNSCWPNVESAQFYKPMPRNWKPNDVSRTRFCIMVSREKTDLVRALLVADPAKRPTILQAAHGPWKHSLAGSAHAACLHLLSSPSSSAGRVEGTSLAKLSEAASSNASTIVTSSAGRRWRHFVLESGDGGVVTQAECQCPGVSSCGSFGVCGGKTQGEMKLCGRPVNSARVDCGRDSSSYCDSCVCKYCANIRFKSDVCVQHQWKLACTEYKFVRAFGPSLNKMLPADLVAFTKQKQILKNPAAAVLAAQMWCPIAVQHFCDAVASQAAKAKTADGLLSLFVDTVRHVSDIRQDETHPLHQQLQDCGWVCGGGWQLAVSG